MVVIQYPSTPLLEGGGFRNLPLLKGMFISLSDCRDNMADAPRSTRTTRMLKTWLPFVDNTIHIGEEFTCGGLIGRIMASEELRQNDGKTIRNLRHLPNPLAFIGILNLAPNYERIPNTSPIVWRRLE